jgi:hypothetical protein
LKHHFWDDVVLVITFTGGNAMAIFTVIRCRNRWQFVLVAVWKSSLSTRLAMWTFTKAVYLRLKTHRNEFEHPPYDDKALPSYFWVILYILGLIVGMVGVFSLIKETWPDIPKVRFIRCVWRDFRWYHGDCYVMRNRLVLAGLYLIAEGQEGPPDENL